MIVLFNKYLYNEWLKLPQAAVSLTGQIILSQIRSVIFDEAGQQNWCCHHYVFHHLHLLFYLPFSWHLSILFSPLKTNLEILSLSLPPLSFSSLSLSVFICIFIHIYNSPWNPEKMLEYLELELSLILCHLIRLLSTECRSFARTLCSLKCWAIPQSPIPTVSLFSVLG